MQSLGWITFYAVSNMRPRRAQKWSKSHIQNTVSPVSYINNLLEWNKYNIVLLGATAVYGHLPEFNEIFRNGRGSPCTNYTYIIDSGDMSFWRSRQNLVITYFLVVRFILKWVLHLLSICAWIHTFPIYQYPTVSPIITISGYVSIENFTSNRTLW